MLPSIVARGVPQEVARRVMVPLQHSLSRSLTQAIVYVVEPWLMFATPAPATSNLKSTFYFLSLLCSSFCTARLGRPALLHVLTHSPLQDYYCYYCAKHKVTEMVVFCLPLSIENVRCPSVRRQAVLTRSYVSVSVRRTALTAMQRRSSFTTLHSTAPTTRLTSRPSMPSTFHREWCRKRSEPTARRREGREGGREEE